MHIFNRIVTSEAAADFRLGKPTDTPEALQRRLTALSNARGGCGFRAIAKEPRKDAQGLTRGDRRRAARAAVFANPKPVPVHFLHSAARRRVASTDLKKAA